MLVAGISKQAYYQYFNRMGNKELQHQAILSKVRTARTQMAYRNMGARPLYYALDIKGVGINSFEQLLSDNGLNVLPRRNKRKTTSGVYWINDVNLVKNTSINGINQVILGDITYLPVNGTFYYIYTLKDAYSKRILGLYGSDSLEAINAVKCLKQAIRIRGAVQLRGCIHHTDAGSQYKSRIYRNTAPYLKWSIAANCLENGMAEQLNYILKSHYLEMEKVNNVMNLNRLLNRVKQLMNEFRPVNQLGYKTPIVFETYIRNIPLGKRKSFVFKDPDARSNVGDFEEGISVKES